MLIRQLLKLKNGCKLTKNRQQTTFEPLLQFNEAKLLSQDDVSRKFEPSVFQNSSTFYCNPKYGVTKSYGYIYIRKITQKRKKCPVVNGLIYIYYIDTDEIPGFFLLLKNHIFIMRSEKYHFYLLRVRILVSPWLLT